jgi:hypothetical protein
MPETTADRLCRRLEAMKAQRQMHEQTWRECYDYTHPIRGSGLQSQDLDARQAQERKARVLDGTGTDSARTLASGVVGGMTPPNALWFKMHRRNATQEELTWFDESSESLWENIHASNYDATAFELALDAVDAGWGVIYIDEDREVGGYVFELWALSQCYVSATKAGGMVDCVYREYEITAEQAVKRFGEDGVSPDTKKLATDKPDEMVQFLHAIYPRDMYVPGSRLAKNLPVASCHVELKPKKLVSEGGYHEFPCVVPRWTMIPKSSYAVGPAFDALPDMKELNAIKALELANCDIAVAGMWIAEDDGVLNPRTVKLGARKIIVANSVESMKPLETGADFSVAFTKEERLVAAIRKTFMADQLEPQDGPVKTATEIHVRVELIRQLLGPLYGRLQSEWLRPLLTRCFGLAMRASQVMWSMGLAGVFNPPPRSLEGKEFSIKFISPIARAQSLEEVSAMDRQEAALGAVGAVKPEVLDTWDFDESARERARLLGAPQKLVRSADQVAAIRKARAEAAQAAREEETDQAIAAATIPKLAEKAA